MYIKQPNLHLLQQCQLFYIRRENWFWGTLFSFSLRACLAELFESLQSHLDAMMPAAKKPFLQQFYSQVLYVSVFRACVFISARTLPSNPCSFLTWQHFQPQELFHGSVRAFEMQSLFLPYWFLCLKSNEHWIPMCFTVVRSGHLLG